MLWDTAKTPRSTATNILKMTGKVEFGPARNPHGSLNFRQYTASVIVTFAIRSI